MPQNNPLDKLIEEKFISPNKFSLDIETLVCKTKLSYIDAIVAYCEKNEIDVESVSKLLTKQLKEKLYTEAVQLNLMKVKPKNVLPF